jgi:kelch-like protein 17 (actinfilin)/kelch-like protein 20
MPAAAAIDGKLYVMGGLDGQNRLENRLSSVERFDPATNAWEAVAPMSTARAASAAAAIDGKLYVMGGYGPNGYLSSVERFDPVTNAWEAVAPMPTARTSPAAAAIDGKLYVMGGHDGQNRLSSVERYDPATNEWAAMTSMALGVVTRSGCAVSM